MFLPEPVKIGCLNKFLLISNYLIHNMFIITISEPSQADKENCGFLFAGFLLYFYQYLGPLPYTVSDLINNKPV